MDSTRVALVWDAPNIDMTLAQLLGHRPTTNERPDMRVLRSWLMQLAVHQEGVNPEEINEEVQACVFVNIPDRVPQAMQGWIQFLLSVGYRVFAKPKQGDSDIDEDIVSYLKGVTASAKHIVVASNDGRRFASLLSEIAMSGCTVTVLGFSEFSSEIIADEALNFIDLQDIPSLLNTDKLQRVRLEKLPPKGNWYEPRGISATETEEALA